VVINLSREVACQAPRWITSVYRKQCRVDYSLFQSFFQSIVADSLILDLDIFCQQLDLGKLMRSHLQVDLIHIEIQEIREYRRILARASGLKARSGLSLP